MPIREADPWRMQYFESVACPEQVRIPTEDADAWVWYPRYKWVYDKPAIAESQDLPCARHGVDPPAFPVFSKPICNMRGMGAGSRVICSLQVYKHLRWPGHMWMVLLEGGMFGYQTALAEGRPEIEDCCGAWTRKHLVGYSGMANFETIGARIIEAHLRFSDQWPDLYGAGWCDALVRLYDGGAWDFDDGGRRQGYRVVLYGAHGIQYRHPPGYLLEEPARSARGFERAGHFSRGPADRRPLGAARRLPARHSQLLGAASRDGGARQAGAQLLVDATPLAARRAQA